MPSVGVRACYLCEVEMLPIAVTEVMMKMQIPCLTDINILV